MGASMASNLQTAGHALFVHDVRRRRPPAPDRGGGLGGQPARGGGGRGGGVHVAARPARGRAGRRRAGRAPPRRPRGSAFFDLSTNAPALVRRLDGLFAGARAHVLDAPVSGGPDGRADAPAGDLGGRRARGVRPLPPAARGDGRPAATWARWARARWPSSCTTAPASRSARVLAEVFSMGVKAGVAPELLWQAVRRATAAAGAPSTCWPRSSCRASSSRRPSRSRLGHKDVSLATALGREFGVPMRAGQPGARGDHRSARPRLGRLDPSSFMLLEEERAGVDDQGAAGAPPADLRARRTVKRRRARAAGRAAALAGGGGRAGAAEPALPSYVQGLDALRQGRYDEATAALGRAMQAAPDPLVRPGPRGGAVPRGEASRGDRATSSRPSGRDCAGARPISGSTPRR